MIDKTKPALGYEVDFTAERYQAIAIATMGDDLGPPGLLRAPDREWPDGERDHTTEAEAIAASHRHREEFVRPDVVAFAEHAVAYFNTHRNEHGEYDCPAYDEWLGRATEPVGFSEWSSAQILAAARGERTLP